MRETNIEFTTLSDLCTDLFLLIVQFRNNTQSGDFDLVYAETRKLFENFEEECRRRNIPAEEVNTAKYGLAAFLDETVLNSRWPYRDKWADNPLQLEYFGTYLAGEIFFDKLEEIRQRAEGKPDLLEIYYLSLLLGFKGKYGVGSEEKLHLLIDTVANELNRLRPPASPDLSPHWKIPDGPRVEAGSRLPRWAVFTCWGAALLALLLYLAMFFTVRSGAQSIQDKIPLQISRVHSLIACSLTA